MIPRITALVLIVVFLCAFIQCGHDGNGEEQTIKNPNRYESLPSKVQEPGFVFYSYTKEFGPRSSKVFVLEVPVDSREYGLKPALSFNMVFGYRLLSEMVDDEGAVAGVNGGFSYAYGRHGGVFIREKQYYNWKTGQYPVLVFKDNRYFFMESEEFNVYLHIKDHSIKIHGINKPHEYTSNIILYNPLYGKTDRTDKEHFCVTIINDIIKSAGTVNKEQNIPADGYLITVGQPYEESLLASLYIPGERVEIVWDPQMNQEDWAFECGDRLVKAGENVAPNQSGWVGTLEGYDPRTAVGINSKGNPVFIVIDGRHPGYSDGVTAKELARIMIELDIKEGALLDGGASSEMLINSEIVNKPSYKGEERPMASAFVVVGKEPSSS